MFNLRLVRMNNKLVQTCLNLFEIGQIGLDLSNLEPESWQIHPMCNSSIILT